MAALFAVIHFGSLAQPQIPIQVRRRYGDRERPARPGATDAADSPFDFSNPAFLNHGDGFQKHVPVLAALLGAELEHAAGLLHDFAD